MDMIGRMKKWRCWKQYLSFMLVYKSQTMKFYLMILSGLSFYIFVLNLFIDCLLAVQLLRNALRGGGSTRCDTLWWGRGSAEHYVMPKIIYMYT